MDTNEWAKWRSGLSDAEYAAHLVEKAPPSIQGSNGSGTTFAIATALWENFDDHAVVETALRLYNDTKCHPRWSESELQHKLESSADKLGAGIGSKKWRGHARHSKVAPMRIGTSHAPPVASAELPPPVVPNSTRWGEMADRLMAKCMVNYLEKQGSSAEFSDWLRDVRGIDPLLAIGCGVGYSDRDDYSVSESIFGTTKPAVIYNGYTVPSKNADGAVVGVTFIRPSQPKQWRYMQLLGGRNHFFGVEWLTLKTDVPRIVFIVEGTINWLSAMQTIGGAVIDGMRTVVLGAPSATTPVDRSIVAQLCPTDIVVALADKDRAGEGGATRWCNAVSQSPASATGHIIYPSLGLNNPVDFNDLLLLQNKGAFNIITWWENQIAAIKESLL